MARTEAQWRPCPLFVSSTFRDFQPERDLLQRVVFPELAEQLAAARRHFEPVDLRSGVETLAHDDEDSKELLVLKVCLDELDRCRPFVIVLLGDRYGWVPPPERLRTVADERGYRGNLQGRSVTALEIEYALLDRPDVGARCFFYLRKPLPYHLMGDAAAVYSDSYSQHPEAPSWVKRLQTLKERIRREHPGRVREYPAEWDTAAGKVTGLEAFGRQVAADLAAEFADFTGGFARPVPQSWQALERETLEDFVEERGHGFVGRGEIIDRLVVLATSSDLPGRGQAGACIIGPPGAGKSGLFARLYHELKKRDVLLLSHAAGVSVRSTSVPDLIQRWAEEVAEAFGLPAPPTDTADPEAVEQRFAALLRQAAERRRVVLLVDALDRFEPTPRARHLTWLPRILPTGARLIATTTEGEMSAALAGRPGIVVVALPPLTPAEGEAVARRVYARYHRDPNPDVLAAVVGRVGPDGAAGAGSPLWLRLALEELNQLDADDFARTEIYTGLPDDARMRALQLDLVAAMPPTVEGLYTLLLERAEQTVGAPLVRRFAVLLAVSRFGWRESDLKVLLKSAFPGKAWDDLLFARLRRCFRAHLMRRGRHEQYDFFHPQIGQAVRALYLADPYDERFAHAEIADYLLGLPAEDVLRQTETMTHVIATRIQDGVARYYLKLSRGSAELAWATQAMATHIRDQVGGPEEAAALLEAAGLTDREIAALCKRYLFDLRKVLSNAARVAHRITVLKAVCKALERLRGQYPDNRAVVRNLAVGYLELGTEWDGQGQQEEARDCLEASMRLRAELSRLDPHDAANTLQLSTGHERLGITAMSRGETVSARSHLQACLRLREELIRQDPLSLDHARALSAAQQHVGTIEKRVGNLSEARRLYEQALALAEEIAVRSSDDPADLRGLVVCLRELAQLARQTGDLATVEHCDAKALVLSEQLYRHDPANRQRAIDVFNSYYDRGVALRTSGRLDEAREMFESARQFCVRCQLEDPDLLVLSQKLGAVYACLGDLAMRAGDAADALRCSDLSVQLVEQAQQRDPDDFELLTALVVVYVGAGIVAQRTGDVAQAVRRLSRAVAIGEEQCRRHPELLAPRLHLASNFARLGDMSAMSGALEEAAVRYRRGIAALEGRPGSESDHQDVSAELASLYRRLGQMSEELGLPTDAEGFLRKSIALYEGLTRCDPSNGDFGEGLVLAAFNMARVCDDDCEGRALLRQCRDTLRALHGTGWQLPEAMISLLRVLESQLGDN